MLLTVGCQKMDEQAVAPKDTQQQVASSEDITRQALAELAVLRQPNGKLINKHFINMVDLGIEHANKYTVVMNSLSKSEQKERQEKVASLLKLPASSEGVVTTALLMGYKSAAEYDAFRNQYAEEKRLLNSEDPDFKKLSTEDVRFMIKAIQAHHRRNGYHDFVSVAGAPALKFKTVVLHNENNNPNSTLPTTASYREEDDDTCRPCYEAFDACATGCDFGYNDAANNCQAGSSGDQCRQQAAASHTNCVQSCADGYNVCAQGCK